MFDDEFLVLVPLVTSSGGFFVYPASHSLLSILMKHAYVYYIKLNSHFVWTLDHCS